LFHEVGARPLEAVKGVRSFSVEHADFVHEFFNAAFETIPLCFAALNKRSRFSTVLFWVTDSPTTGQVTPFGLRKSICGSITTNAVLSSCSTMSLGGNAGLSGSA
jgi:hypothetical protein